LLNKVLPYMFYSLFTYCNNVCMFSILDIVCLGSVSIFV